MKPLTKREHQVMLLAAAGYTNKETALHCGCDIKTVEKHRQSVYYKWGVNSTLAMVRVALRENKIALEYFLSSRVDENVIHAPPQHLIAAADRHRVDRRTFRPAQQPEPKET